MSGDTQAEVHEEKKGAFPDRHRQRMSKYRQPRPKAKQVYFCCAAIVIPSVCFSIIFVIDVWNLDIYSQVEWPQLLELEISVPVCVLSEHQKLSKILILNLELMWYFERKNVEHRSWTISDWV